MNCLITLNYGSVEALSASTSIVVGNPYSSSFTSIEGKFHRDSPKMVAPIRRLYRNLSGSCLNLYARHLLKSQLEKKTIAMSKHSGASKVFAVENDKMSKFPENEVAVLTSNRQGCHVKLEHDTLSGNTSHTSTTVRSPLSKICVYGSNQHGELNRKSKSPLGPIFCLFPEGERTGLGKRRAELNQLEREKQELGKRRLELGQLERKKQALAAQVMAIRREHAGQVMAESAFICLLT
jgi:hypothetical protein